MDEPTTWVQQIGKIGPWIVSLAALAQVWVIAIWKNYVKKSRIEVNKIRQIEIGYSAFGPNVGLLGTLRVENKDVFINEMRVTVRRKEDKAQRDLSWYVFRSISIPVTNPGNVMQEMAT